MDSQVLSLICALLAIKVSPVDTKTFLIKEGRSNFLLLTHMFNKKKLFVIKRMDMIFIIL